MPLDSFPRRLSYIFLCAAPVVVVAVAAPRALRNAGAHHAVGIVLFAAMSLAVWVLGGRSIRAAAQERRQLALGGALLVAPFALVGLLWVGLGTPWDATPKENEMRYLVLLAMAIAEVGGFLLVREALSGAGERFHSTLVLTGIVLAGPLYAVWNAFMFGVWVAREQTGSVPAAFASLDLVLDVVLDAAAALTYLATAALAMSLARARWLGRRASVAFVVLNLVALLLLVNRGLKFLAPAELAAPWYTVPGFIVGIPAVPYIMPFLLGVVLLRRAGQEQR